MKKPFNSRLAAMVTAFTLAVAAMAPAASHAQTGASALSALSALPVASVVMGASAATASIVAVPVALSVSGAVLVVKAVESTARGTVYLLERASDGAGASIEIVGNTVAGASLVAGTAVTVSVIGAGVVLSAAGEVIAFLPNALGRALMHNERLT